MISTIFSAQSTIKIGYSILFCAKDSVKTGKYRKNISINYAKKYKNDAFWQEDFSGSDENDARQSRIREWLSVIELKK